MEINGLVNRLSHLCIENPLILNGQLLLGQQCISHPFTSMANDVLSAGRDIIKKIRDDITFVVTSGYNHERFFELWRQLQVPSEVHLLLDDQGRWETTYQMLVSALDLKEVFSILDAVIHEYKQPPSTEDWKQVEVICTYLRTLSDALSSIVTTSPCPPAIALFEKAFSIHAVMNARAAASCSSSDPFVGLMQGKIEKYWKECGLVLGAAVVMDPRYKMRLVEFSFPKIFGEDSDLYVKMVDDGVRDLFAKYLALSPPPPPDREHDQVGRSISEYGLADFDVYIMEAMNQQQQFKSEMDRYLDENLESRGSNLDALEWWKHDSVRLRYPTLSKMATDVLSIPVSTA